MKIADMTPEQYQMAQARYAKYRAGLKYAATQERFKATKKRNITAAAGRRRVKAEEPEKYRAWLAVAAEIRAGRMTKPSECRCGRRVRLDAHHHLGYSEEHHLNVEWLCRRCHKAAHREGVVIW